MKNQQRKFGQNVYWVANQFNRQALSLTGILVLVMLSVTPRAAAQQPVLTYHNDNQRTGQNLNETILNTSNVNSTTFGKLFILPADGKVDAEPLYVPGLSIGGTTHNVVFVASENDSAYAYDADTGTQLWKVTALLAGETASDDRNCSQVEPTIGITATPVIDLSSGPHGTIYLVAMSKNSSGTYFQRLHALDITTGAEEFGGPVTITATWPGSGAEGNGTTLTFNPAQHKERAGLLLLNNTVYMGFSSHCDIAPYNGWVMGYDESTLVQTQLFNFTPNGSDGSVWQSGAGMAADSSGNIYLLAANGTADTTLTASGFPTSGDYGNAFLKLSTSSDLAVADYFNEYNTVSESSADEDLGSGGAMLLPDLTDASNTVWQLAVGAGKDRNIYLIDRNNMGKYNSSTNNIYQQLTTPLTGGVWGAPAYFNGAIYYGGTGDYIRMFNLVDAKLQATPSSKTSITFPSPGATPSISANGTANGILWATENTNPAVLYAYDATNLATMLYNSNQASGSRDQFGAGNKFITPMIANGKVYVATTTGVGVFGLLSVQPAELSPSTLTFASQTENTTSNAQTVILTNNTSSSLTSIVVSTSGDFGQTNNCGTSLAGTSTCQISVTFAPLATGTLTGELTITDSATNSPQTVGLTGTGAAASPKVSLSPTSLTFSGQILNTSSAAKTVTLSNTGAGTLTISKIATTGNFAVGTGTNACGTSLAGSSSCTIYVTFTPTASGSRTGKLSITDNASGSPQSVSLSGTGMTFTVTASPTSRSIASGSSTTYTVTVAPVSGFTGTVSLTCSGAPSTATCTLSASSVALSGSSKTSTATVKTGVGSKTANGTYTLTLTGTDGGLSSSTKTTLKVP